MHSKIFIHLQEQNVLYQFITQANLKILLSDAAGDGRVLYWATSKEGQSFWENIFYNYKLQIMKFNKYDIAYLTNTYPELFI